jgi:hypothetical protein
VHPPPSPAWANFYPHDGVYARKQRVLLCASNDGSVSLAQLNVWNATEPLIILYTRVILTLERVQLLEERIFPGEQLGHYKTLSTQFLFAVNCTVQ